MCMHHALVLPRKDMQMVVLKHCQYSRLFTVVLATLTDIL
jgi:hypothetical protein